jgi:hypothetical protein
MRDSAQSHLSGHLKRVGNGAHQEPACLDPGDCRSHDRHFMIGRSSAQQADWKLGTAYLLGDPSSPGFSARVDDWAYGAEGAVPHWIDRKGVTHEGGWPTCLMPPGLNSEGERQVPVRFAAVTTSVDGLTWRPVLMVDCRD